MEISSLTPSGSCVHQVPSSSSTAGRSALPGKCSLIGTVICVAQMSHSLTAMAVSAIPMNSTSMAVATSFRQAPRAESAYAQRWGRCDSRAVGAGVASCVRDSLKITRGFAVQPAQGWERCPKAQAPSGLEQDSGLDLDEAYCADYPAQSGIHHQGSGS